MSKKSGKEQYLDAKYVIENPNKFDHRDVARAKEFCNGYEAGQHETIVMPHELNTVELAYKTLVWMIHSGRFDDYKASDIRKKLNNIYGEEIMLKVKEKCRVA